MKLGDRRLLTVLGCIVFLGSVVVSLGSIENSFPLMIIGRFIYGLGGDSITSTQWSLVIEYFHSDYEVGIAMVNSEYLTFIKKIILTVNSVHIHDSGNHIKFVYFSYFSECKLIFMSYYNNLGHF